MLEDTALEDPQFASTLNGSNVFVFEIEDLTLLGPLPTDGVNLSDDNVWFALDLLRMEMRNGCPNSSLRTTHKLYRWIINTDPTFSDLIMGGHGAGEKLFEFLVCSNYGDDRAFRVRMLIDKIVDLTGWVRSYTVLNFVRLYNSIGAFARLSNLIDFGHARMSTRGSRTIRKRLFLCKQ
jgi:hypothetical protein